MLWLTMREVTKYTMKIWRNSDSRIFLEKQKKRNRTDESFLNHLVRFLFRCAGFIPAVLPGRRRSVRRKLEKPLFRSALDGLFSVFAEQAPNRPI